MDSIRSLIYRSDKKRAILFQVQQGVVEELDRLDKAYGTSRATLLREAVLQLLEQGVPIIEKIQTSKTINAGVDV